MSTEEQIAQRRREKILSRSQAEAEENQKQEEGPSVFQRYKHIKDQQKQQQKLIDISKGVGILIVILSHILPVDLVFVTVIIIMTGAALQASEFESKKGTEFKELGKLGALLGKLQHIQRILLVLKVLVNVFCSYLVGSVLFEQMVRQVSVLADL